MLNHLIKLGVVATVIISTTSIVEGQRRVPVKDYRQNAAQQNAPTTQPSTQKTFTVIMEAKLPEGFPGPGPVAKAVEKVYPVSRIAVADNQRRGAFFRLFRHIQKNEVAMTTPVEMEVKRDDQRESYSMQSMGFFYEAPKQGKSGQDETVVVKDYPKMRVVSVGIAGSPSSATMDFSKKLIEAYLKENKLKTKGNYRIMGYNSPSVPNARKFFEMQVQVEPVVEVKKEAEKKPEIDTE